MNKIDFLKLKSLLRIQKEVQPKTYLDDMASNGYLDEYLNEVFKKRAEDDPDFRRRIFESYYEWSPEVNENLETYYLESICEALSFFIEYTSLCKTQEQ
jgi:hypothetical protein